MSESWLVLYPEIAARERAHLARVYPFFTECVREHERGHLSYHGELLVRGQEGTRRVPVALEYPSSYPYSPPLVIPLEDLPGKEPHEDWKLRLKIFNARHQMPRGELCLVESDPFRRDHSVTTGVQILQRAERWFVDAERGTMTFDSAEAELDSHFDVRGHLLVSPELYDERLGSSGRLAVALLTPHKTGQAVTIAVTWGSDANAEALDARRVVDRVFPNLAGEDWDVGRSILLNDDHHANMIVAGRLLLGSWWTLEREPRPVRTGSALLDELEASGYSREQVLREIGGRIDSCINVVVGLRYPGRSGGYDWLFPLLKIREDYTQRHQTLDDPTRVRLIEEASIGVLRKHPLLERELDVRNRHRIPPALATSSFVFFGAGALGSGLADLLTKAGVPRVRVIDGDTMTVGNATRHTLGVNTFGWPKSAGVACDLLMHNPFADIEYLVDNVLVSRERVESHMAGIDVAVSTMADESAESFVNEVAVRVGRPVYYVRALRGGAVGRIFRVVPGRDACKYCLGLAMAGKDERAEWLKVDDLEETLIAHECGNPVLASSAADLAIVSALAAKVIIDDIGRGFGPANHWLWAAEGVEGHPALSVPYRLTERAVSPDPECPFCAPPPTRRVIVPAAVFGRMTDRVRQAGKNETGGVLVGLIEENGTARVVDASDAGPGAVETPERFDRDVAYCQQWLDERWRPGACEYLGEWHSHTSGEARPSPLDAQSLAGIAGTGAYGQPTPVLIILKSEDSAIADQGAFCFASHRPYSDAELVVETGDEARDEDGRCAEVRTQI